MNAQEPLIEFTIEVTRKDTGIVETYTVLGTPETLPETTDGDNS
jgi:hypothetical protein